MLNCAVAEGQRIAAQAIVTTATARMYRIACLGGREMLLQDAGEPQKRKRRIATCSPALRTATEVGLLVALLQGERKGGLLERGGEVGVLQRRLHRG